MNTLRTHKDSARFGLTEYSDMTHEEFLAARLDRNPMLSPQINSIFKDGYNHRQFSPHSIMRYTRNVIGDTNSLPNKVDWYEKEISY